MYWLVDAFIKWSNLCRCLFTYVRIIYLCFDVFVWSFLCNNLIIDVLELEHLTLGTLLSLLIAEQNVDGKWTTIKCLCRWRGEQQVDDGQYFNQCTATDKSANEFRPSNVIRGPCFLHFVRQLYYNFLLFFSFISFQFLLFLLVIPGIDVVSFCFISVVNQLFLQIFSNLQTFAGRI